MSLIQRLKIKMSEETVTKEEVTENPVIQDEGVSLDGGGSNGSKIVVLNLEKGLKYELVKLLPKERKAIADREETVTMKKIWLKTYRDHVGSSYTRICDKTGIARRTFTRWKKEDQEFRESIFATKEDRVEIWEDRIISVGMSGNVSALKFLLENNDPKYSKKLKVETYTGDKTYEDLIDQVNDELNNEDGNNKIEVGAGSGSGNNEGREKETIEQATDTDNTEDKKQEGEDSPISA